MTEDSDIDASRRAQQLTPSSHTAAAAAAAVVVGLVKPGFHSNAIACVGKQPIMVATASTEHSYWLALAFVV